MTAVSAAPRSEFRSALVDIAPAMVAAVPMGVLYGALGVAKGMAPAEVVLMSALVFAGGAQFAAIEIWTYPVPVAALVVSTALINARHLLMGASLGPKLARLGPAQRFLGCYALADENWALAERRAAGRALSPWYFLGMAAVFWANWVTWSLAGALLGPVLGDPRRLGADFAFTAIFIGLIVSLSKGRASGVVVAASAATAALVRVLVGSPWHVVSGALAGIVVAALLHRDSKTAR
jgi:4-azaleucine resistance transporter AzlC